MAGIDQLFGARRHVGQDAQPTERVDLLIDAQVRRWQGGTTHAPEAVAAGDEIAAQLMIDSVGPVGQSRPVHPDVMQGDVRRLPDNRSIAGQARRNQVLHHLALAVDRDGLARQPGQVDSEAPAVHSELDPLVDQPLAVQALGDAGLFQKLDSAVLQNAGTDASLDVSTRPVLEDDALDPVQFQQACQQQSCRSRADDPHLRALLTCHSRPLPPTP
jgi:hypothetical protein